MRYAVSHTLYLDQGAHRGATVKLKGRIEGVPRQVGTREPSDRWPYTVPTTR